MLSRFRLAPALALAALALHAQAQDQLAGQVVGDTYVSASGLFKITVPVSEALGGTITDTANEVTFRDAFTTYVSIVVFPMDATQRFELSIKGRKDYLAYFFENYVRPDFQRSFAKVEVAKDGIFDPNLEGGSLITYVLLPGGSMFPDPVLSIDPSRPPPTAKRGNLVFVRDNTIFVISVELGERATEGTAYDLTTDQENQLLREKLTDICNRITFLGAAASASAAPAAGS
jgi:hypothetical protein